MGKWLSGRASALHAEGPEFDPPFLHYDWIDLFVMSKSVFLVPAFQLIFFELPLQIKFPRFLRLSSIESDFEYQLVDMMRKTNADFLQPYLFSFLSTLHCIPRYALEICLHLPQGQFRAALFGTDIRSTPCFLISSASLSMLFGHQDPFNTREASLKNSTFAAQACFAPLRSQNSFH